MTDEDELSMNNNWQRNRGHTLST